MPASQWESCPVVDLRVSPKTCIGVLCIVMERRRGARQNGEKTDKMQLASATPTATIHYNFSLLVLRIMYEFESWKYWKQFEINEARCYCNADDLINDSFHIVRVHKYSIVHRLVKQIKFQLLVIITLCQRMHTISTRYVEKRTKITIKLQNVMITRYNNKWNRINLHRSWTGRSRTTCENIF